MTQKRWRWLSMLAVLALVIAACGDDTGGGDDGEVLKVAFVHVGATADKGW